MAQSLEDSFHELVNGLRESQQFSTNVAEMAEVLSYSGGEADVTPLIDDSGGADEVGVINACPVLVSALIGIEDGKVVPRDLKKGDTVFIVFNNRDLDNFEGKKFTKSSDRMHDINDAVVVGVVNL
jgi:hypothetical protein